MEPIDAFDLTVLNSLQTHVAILDRRGVIVAVNTAWRQFALENEAPSRVVRGVGMSYLEICRAACGPDGESAQVCLSGLEAVLQGDASEFEWEYPCHTRAAERWFLMHAIPLSRTSGGLVVFHINVTERKRAQIESHERLKQLQSMLDSTAEGIYSLDLEGRCTFCNHAALRLLGYDEPAQVIGRNMHDLMHHTRPDGSPYPRHECRIFKAVSRGQGTHVDDEVLWRSDGTHFPAEYWSYPIRWADEVVGAVVTFLDITEQRIAAEQLRQAQKMEAIGHLTGGIAHDFNNLLAIAVGNLELLQERLAGRDELQDLAQRALTALERGSTLVQRLLAFTRQQPLRVQPVDLNALVAGIIELLRRTLGEAIQVKTVLSPDLWLTLADPAQLENALVNLALNARDAMPRGGDLSIETANAWLGEADVAEDQEARPGPYSLLVVRDNGTGMAPGVVQRAFEPFFTTKGVGRGSGLGLSMVYGFVKQSGGQIKIESVSGRGTTIRVYLPRTTPALE